MKIINVLRSHAWGGLELYTLDFIKKNAPASSLLCPKGSRLSQEAQAKGIHVTHSWQALFKNWDIIHVHQRQDLPGVRLSLMGRNKIKLIYTLMMNAPKKDDAYHRWIYQRVDALLTSSKWVKEEVQKNFPISKEKVFWVPYGRDFTQESKEILAQKNTLLPKNQNKIIFGTLCRLDRAKGVVEIAKSLDFLDAATQKQIEIWIIGDPTLKRLEGVTPIYEPDSEAVKSELLSLSAKYPDQLKLLPFQKNPWPYLASMDVFILGSYNETYSLSVLDAMSLGVSVIGTEAGGTIEQIGQNQERGVLIKPKNAQSIAGAIELYLKDQSLILSKGNSAKSWVLNGHSWPLNQKLITEIYNS